MKFAKRRWPLRTRQRKNQRQACLFRHARAWPGNPPQTAFFAV